MIKIDHVIDDADIESGVAQALNAHNETLDTPLTQDEFISAAIDATLEAYRGSAKRAILAKAELLDYSDLAVLQPVIDAKAAVISGQPAVVKL